MSAAFPEGLKAHIAASRARDAARDAARQRLAEIGRETEALRARIADQTSALRGDAGKAALAGRALSLEVMKRRRAKIESDRTSLESLMDARPMAEQALREAEAAADATRRELSAAAMPLLHEKRLQEAAKLAAAITALASPLAAVKMIDRVSRHYAGDTPFIRQLPEGFYGGEPLVDKLIAAIAPQLLENPLFAKEIDTKSKDFSASFINFLERKEPKDSLPSSSSSSQKTTVDLIATMQISVLVGYSITGYKPDGAPKLRAHSEEKAAGQRFSVERKQAEALIRDGHARLAPIDDGGLI